MLSEKTCFDTITYYKMVVGTYWKLCLHSRRNMESKNMCMLGDTFILRVDMSITWSNDNKFPKIRVQHAYQVACKWMVEGSCYSILCVEWMHTLDCILGNTYTTSGFHTLRTPINLTHID